MPVLPPLCSIMKTVTISDIKRLGAKALKVNEPIYVIVNSRPCSVVLPVQKYESLIEAIESFGNALQLKQEKEMSLDEIDGDNEKWKTIVDFTEDGKKTGMPAEDLLDIIQKINLSLR